MRWCSKSPNPRLARRYPGVFALWPHAADVANTVPNLFPTRAQVEAGVGLIIGDGLTQAMADVGSSVQTLSPVIRGRCRNVPPSERAKTAKRSGPRSSQPGVFRWTRFSVSFQIQSLRLDLSESRSSYTGVAFSVGCSTLQTTVVKFKLLRSLPAFFSPVVTKIFPL